jgi:hypothetical protein
VKENTAVVLVLSFAALLCIGVIYLGVQLSSATGQIRQLRAANAAEEAHLAAIQASVDGFKRDLKQYDSVIGAQGTLQVLASSLQNGDMDLSVKSLKVVSRGKPLVTLRSSPEAGGVIQVGSSDGTSAAEISSAPGKAKMSLKATTGADAALVVHVATLGDDGYLLQKGPSEDPAARSDGAGLQILDEGADFYMAQSAGGNVSIDTSSGDERAKVSIWSEGSPKKAIYLSLGPKDISPFVSVAGVASGNSLTLLPDRLSLANREGTVLLAAAEDADGGFFFANDKTGARRAIMTAGTDGHGSISVFGNDSRSNTLYPEYNIQRTGSNQK